ncbi:MAG: DUF434 domain-containing protein [Lachnospiraceae bacterium]|nr:DUF434 domain-containing protein [Lachnospiraceae bacterium]
MNARRGYVPEDERDFSPEAIGIMRKASRHVVYLINEGYDLKRSSTFVADYYLLSKRQRLAVLRSVATDDQLKERENKRIPFNSLSRREIWVDGFNTIITLEVMLSRSILLFGMDGTIRDLATLRGTYRVIPETEKAARLLFDILKEAGVSKINILLDEPVSNSGRLKTLLAEVHEDYSMGLDIRIKRNVDKALYDKEYVVTSDSIILDNCASWVNISVECMKRMNMTGLKVW